MSFKPHMRRLLPVLTVFMPIALVYLLGGFDFLERARMDAQFELFKRSTRSDIVLVELDSKSVSSLPSWPWPRGYHATVLENLLDAGAVRVGFDVDFSSPSTMPEEDAELAAAIAAAGNRVVLPVFQQWQHTGPNAGMLTNVEPPRSFARTATLGTINIQPGSDGLVREYRTHGRVGRDTVPSFANALAGRIGDDEDSFYIDYSISTAGIQRLSYVDVLSGSFPPELVADRVVIIGATALELNDQIAVPIAAALPGPMLQVLAYESLAQGRTIHRSSAPWTLFVALLLVLGVAPWFERASWRQGLVAIVGGSIALLGATAVIQHWFPIFVDATPWSLVLVGLYGFVLVRRTDEQAIGLRSQDAAIRRTETMMRHVVENSFDAVVTIQPDGTIETFNRAAQSLFKFTLDDVLGTSLADLVHCPPAEDGGSIFDRPTSSPIESVGRRADGSSFPLELVVTSIDTLEDRVLVAVLRDITERKAHQAELQHQATHDPLTDLPNRFLMVERTERALASASQYPVSVIILDLDRFKEINDALGHHTGDLLLQQVARRLESPLQPGETIARLGGDEFAILLPGAGLEESRKVAQKMIELLKSPFHIENLTFQVDTSVGIAIYPEHGEEAQTLLQRADVAMYVAKRRRSNLAVYRHDYDYNSIRHLMLRGDLRSAIEENNLELYYQPKMNATDDAVVGVEALVRWKHPQHGYIPTDEFIGLAEHSGLIRPLTQWVIRTALDQAAAWSERGLPLRMSINLSARNLLEEDLPQTLGHVLGMARLPADRLVLEITESVIMEDPDRALEVIIRLRSLGVDISIDDFGTGYSSLGYLMKLPAEELKIDKSFVMQMEQDPNSATIVHSTIELAHNLGLKVVAEGVETATTWQVLKELGCDYGQGYFFSKPQPAPVIEQWIRERAGAGALMLPAIDGAADADPFGNAGID